MQEDPLAALAWMCELELVVLGAALLFVLVARRRAEALVGEGASSAPEARRVRVLRMLPTALVLAALFGYAAVQPESDLAFDGLFPAFGAQALALVVAWCSPAEGEVVAGSRGLQVGWSAWTYEELASDRAGGRWHGAELAFQDGAVRRSVRLGPEALVRVRAGLAALAPSSPEPATVVDLGHPDA